MTTLRELRKLASSIGIKKYSRLTKSQLEAEISKLNAATAEITTASDNDNAQASQPANVATPHSNTADSAKSLLSPDYFKGKSFDEIKQAFSGATLKQLKGFALCYTIPYFNRMNKSKLIDALASKISLILEERYGYITAENVTGEGGYAQQDDIIIPAPKTRSIPQPVSAKFIPGTVYAGNDSGNHIPVKILSITDDGYATTDCISALIKYAKIQTVAGVEYAVFPKQYRNIEIWADKPEITANAQSETSTQQELPVAFPPENLYDDDSFSDTPGDNSCPDMDIPECHEPDTALPTICNFFTDNPKYEDYSYMPDIFSPDSGRHFANGYELTTYFINGIHTVSNPAFMDLSTLLGNQPASLRGKACALDVADYQTLNRDDLIDAILEKSNELRENIKNSGEKFGFTVIPPEHIERPPYRPIHDTPLDDIPCVNVQPCDIPTHSPAAVVPYSQAASIRNFFHIIAIYLRMWLALHISRPVLRLEDFPDGLFTHYPTRKKNRANFRRAVFEVGASYTATCYTPSMGLRSFTFLVTGRCVYEDTYDKRNGVMLFITCNSPDNHDFEGRAVLRYIDTVHGVEVYNHRRGYEMGLGDVVFSFRADKRDNVPFPFKDTTPSEPNYKPCGDCTRFISREFLNYSDNPEAVLQPLMLASASKKSTKFAEKTKL